jgi:hypothetical protein
MTKGTKAYAPLDDTNLPEPEPPQPIADSDGSGGGASAAELEKAARDELRRMREEEA